METRKRVLGAVIALAVSVMAASELRGEAKPEQVTIGVYPALNAEVVARHFGWLEKEMGVKINWKQFESGQDVSKALTLGAVDICPLATGPAAAAIAREVPYEVIWIHHVEAEEEFLIVRKGKGIKTVADLAGKKVAVPFGSTSHFGLLGALKLAGMTPAQVNLVDLRPEAMLAAWRRGDIDAGYVWEPTARKMVEADGEAILTRGEMADKGYLSGDMAMVRKDFAEKYPDLIVRYLRVQSRAVDLWTKEPTRTASALGRAFGIPTGQAEREMKTRIVLSGKEQLSEAYLGTEARRGRLATVLKNTADFFVGEKVMQSAPPLATFERAINPSYLEKALK